MYSINNEKNNYKLVDECEIINLDGYLMPTRSKNVIINGQNISTVKIMNSSLAHPFVQKKVNKNYKKLILLLTELLTSDDDSGDSYMEALNQIEKFRLEIKNKYRHYLEKKELEIMSKQLMTLQKDAKNKYAELCNDINITKSGKSR